MSSIAKRLKDRREKKAKAEYRPPEVTQTGGRDGRGLNLLSMDRSRTMLIDQNAAPFEYMSSSGLLRLKSDPDGFEQTRFSAGMRLRSLMIGAEPRSLKTVELDGMPSGQGGINHIGDFKLDCMHELNRVRSTLDDGLSKYRTIWRESQLYRLLEKLVYLDDWTVIEVTPKKREAVVKAIHYGLDCLALLWGMITTREFEQRWA